MSSFLVNLSRKLIGWPPAPTPYPEKQKLIARYSAHAGNLIETGTFKGDMIEYQRDKFARLITIELDDSLHAAAQERFAAFPHVSVLHGDSGELLPEAIRMIDGPAVFWLDGHYCGGPSSGNPSHHPIMKELASIAARKVPGDIVLIDDARLFGWRGYPPKSAIRSFVAENMPGHVYKLDGDIMCIVPEALASA